MVRVARLDTPIIKHFVLYLKRLIFVPVWYINDLQLFFFKYNCDFILWLGSDDVHYIYVAENGGQGKGEHSFMLR